MTEGGQLIANDVCSLSVAVVVFYVNTDIYSPVKNLIFRGSEKGLGNTFSFLNRLHQF